MIHDHKVLGFPLVVFTAEKAEIQAIDPNAPGALAFTTDTHEFAFYNGTDWVFHTEAGGVGGSTWSYNEIPSGVIDGNNTAFVLAHTPNPSWIQLFQNGVLLEPDANDYAISGTGITMTFAPETGDKLRAYYMYQEL